MPNSFNVSNINNFNDINHKHAANKQNSIIFSLIKEKIEEEEKNEKIDDSNN